MFLTLNSIKLVSHYSLDLTLDLMIDLTLDLTGDLSLNNDVILHTNYFRRQYHPAY